MESSTLTTIVEKRMVNSFHLRLSSHKIRWKGWGHGSSGTALVFKLEALSSNLTTTKISKQKSGWRKHNLSGDDMRDPADYKLNSQW
jgi:hypothetical protein